MQFIPKQNPHGCQSLIHVQGTLSRVLFADIGCEPSPCVGQVLCFLLYLNSCNVWGSVWGFGTCSRIVTSSSLHLCQPNPAPQTNSHGPFSTFAHPEPCRLSAAENAILRELYRQPCLRVPNSRAPFLGVVRVRLLLNHLLHLQEGSRHP